MDKAEKEAAELLPCKWGGCVCEDRGEPVYCTNCSKRPAVAAKLRELEAEVERWKLNALSKDDEIRQIQEALQLFEEHFQHGG